MTATVIDPQQAQRDTALRKAKEVRAVRIGYRRALRDGSLTLEAVMLDPPPIFADMLIIDLIREARTWRRRQGSWLERIGRRAVAEQVNLCIPLSRASARTRMWVAHEARWNQRRVAA
jgi:hypothetical protein